MNIIVAVLLTFAMVHMVESEEQKESGEENKGDAQSGEEGGEQKASDEAAAPQSATEASAQEDSDKGSSAIGVQLGVPCLLAFAATFVWMYKSI